MILWFLFVAGPLVLVLPEVGCPATPTMSRSSSINSQEGASTSGAPEDEGPSVANAPVPEPTPLSFVLGFLRRDPDPCETLYISNYAAERTAANNYCRDAGEAYTNLSAEMKEPCPRAVSASCQPVRGSNPQNLHYQCTIVSTRDSLFPSCVSGSKKNSLRHCASVVLGKPRDTWIKGEPKQPHRYTSYPAPTVPIPLV